MTTLVYVGDGFLPGVPARDLSADEVELYGGVEALLATGLYQESGPESLQAAAVATNVVTKPGKAGKAEVSDGRG